MQMKSQNKVINKKKSLAKSWQENKYLYLLCLPGLLYLILFKYLPMKGILIAFQDYNIIEGISGSKWVGFSHFARFFGGEDFVKVFGNTLKISLLQLLFGFPAPVLFAILLNELKDGRYKKCMQTISYLPHFLSWVVVAGMMTTFLSPSSGMVNAVIQALGGEPIYFMAEKEMFVPMLIISAIWKEIGWGSVVYLAALSGINAEIADAAAIDGASRLQKIIYIFIPAIFPTIAIMLIMRMGTILDSGFDQIFNLYSPATYDVADVLDTYVYRMGVQGYQYGFSTAVGLFKSVVGIIMVLVTNTISKKLSEGEISI